MYSGCDYLYKSCLYTFWPCHPYFILQFYSVVFILVRILHQEHTLLKEYFIYGLAPVFTLFRVFVESEWSLSKITKIYSSPMSRFYWFTGMHIRFWVRHADELQEQRNRTHVLLVVPVFAGYRLLHSGSGAVTVLDP